MRTRKTPNTDTFYTVSNDWFRYECDKLQRQVENNVLTVGLKKSDEGNLTWKLMLMPYKQLLWKWQHFDKCWLKLPTVLHHGDIIISPWFHSYTKYYTKFARVIQNMYWTKFVFSSYYPENKEWGIFACCAVLRKSG